MPRMDNFQDLFARLAKMGALHQSLGSAHIPLLGFESTGGTVEDPEYTAAASSANHHLAGEARNIQDIVTGGYKPQYVDMNIAHATLMAIRAYGRPPVIATQLAREALKIHPWCPEAYNVLATHAAQNLQEALDYYLEGIRQGPLILSPEDYARATDGDNQAFLIPPMRALFRCVNGAAIVLLKMGRYKESYDMYKRLEKLDNHGYQYSTYTNFRYHLPILFLRWKGVAFAERYMHARVQTDNYSLTSTGLAWVWTQALMDFKKMGKPSFPWRYFGMSVDKPDSATAENMCRTGCAMVIALQNAPLVLEFLAGERALPRGPLPTTFTSLDCLAQAVAYIHAAGDLWTSTPGAVDWALKCRNLFDVMMMLRNSEFSKPYSLGKVKALLAKGVIRADGSDPFENEMLFDAACCRKADGELIDLVITAVGCNPNAVNQGLTPLNKTLYYDANPGVIKALIRNGARVPRPSAYPQSPLAMAINQGNHVALRAALEEAPTIAADRSELRCLFLELFQTNVLMCVKGVGPKCQRCRFDSTNPHSPEVSFERCVDVLAELGLRANEELERAVKGEISHPIQAGLMTRLKIQGKLQDRKKKAAKTLEFEASDPRTSEIPVMGIPDTGEDRPSELAKEKMKKKKKKKVVAGCLCCGVKDVKLLTCGRCRSAGYCSAECQRADWSTHKAQCKVLAGNISV